MDISFFKSLQSPGFSLFKREKSILGIDIGAASVKLVQIRLSDERAVLETYGELSTGPYASKNIGQGVRLMGGKATEIVQDLIRETGATANEAIVAMPLHNSFVTTVEIPKMQNKDLKTVMQYEARRYIPIPLAEVVIDWWQVPDIGQNEEGTIATPARTSTQVILVAVTKDLLEKYRSIIKNANLNVAAFEIELFSSIRSVIGRERSGVLIVDFGAISTKMAILDQGIIRANHGIERGMQNITTALSESLGIGFERAEILKREIGLSSRAEHQEVMKVMTPLLDFMLIEIERFVVGHTRRHKGVVSKIFLVGGGALLPGLSDYMVKKFGVEVIIGNPFSRLEYPAFFQPVLKEIGPSFSVAVGLALRGLK
jgi:type IV pilus assembly protein PilM